VSLLIVIPARLGSTRLPRKLVREVGGKPLLAHTIAAARRIPDAEIWVAADDPQLVAIARAEGVPAMLTSTGHVSGTDRIAELVTRLAVPDERIVVNLQGDEPLMPPEPILAVARLLEADPGAAIATLGQLLTDAAELFDPACVKVVVDRRGRALYFSRAPVPWARDAFAQGRDALPAGIPWLRHLGLYAYRVGPLKQLAALPPSWLEQVEALEQLRALDHGLGIAVGQSPSAIPPGIDTEADLRRLEQRLDQPRAELPTRGAAPASNRGVAPKRLLFVCMGNICRSPLAAVWAAKRAREAGLQLDIASAGTHAFHRDRGADPRSQAIGRAAGLNLLSHKSRPVDVTDFVRYDLVIGHDQRNLDDLLAVCPAGLRHKVRLLLDFAPGQGPREVPDPYAGDHEAFILAFRLIRAGVDGLIEQITASTRG
jgi:3-deoxy-manno-octulosonate cytidylyltransferase (CMP-KDO synthetase)